jgi:hypothetical protein
MPRKVKKLKEVKSGTCQYVVNKIHSNQVSQSLNGILIITMENKRSVPFQLLNIGSVVQSVHFDY